MIVIILGPDAWTARHEVAALLRGRDPDGFNTTAIDGQTASLAQIAAEASSVGFLSPGRVVVVRDLLARAARPSRAAAPANDAADDEVAAQLDLAPLFAAVPADNLLLLVDLSLTAVPAAIRKIAPADAQIIVAEPPRGASLLAWLERAAAETGGRFDRGVARLLAERTFPQTWSAKPTNPRYDRPPNLDLLSNEVAKLTLAAHPEPIARRHLDALVPTVEEDRTFRFIDAAANGALPAALSMLGDLLDAGEEPAKLFAQVCQQQELAAVLDAAGAGVDPQTVGRALGLPNPARMSGVAASRRGRPAASAADSLASALLVDRQAKRGELRKPADELYHLVLGSALGRSDGHQEGGT